MAELRVLLTESPWEMVPGMVTFGDPPQGAGYGRVRRLVASLVVDAQAVQQRCWACEEFYASGEIHLGRVCVYCENDGWLPVPPGSYDNVELWGWACGCGEGHTNPASPSCGAAQHGPLGVVAHVDVIERERVRRWPVMSQKYEGIGVLAEWVTKLDPRMHIGQMDAGGNFDMHGDIFDALPDVPVLALLSAITETESVT